MGEKKFKLIRSRGDLFVCVRLLCYENTEKNKQKVKENFIQISLPLFTPEKQTFTSKLRANIERI